MPRKHAEDFEYLANNPNYVPDPEIEEFMEFEISHSPKDPELLAHRLRNNTAASPRGAGGCGAAFAARHAGRGESACPVAQQGCEQAARASHPRAIQFFRAAPCRHEERCARGAEDAHGEETCKESEIKETLSARAGYRSGPPHRLRM